MAIDINLDGLSDPTAIASAVSNIDSFISSEIVGAESSLNSLVQKATSNCDVFGSLGAMVSSASATFSATIKDATTSIQGNISSFIESAGSAIKTLKSLISEIASTVKSVVAKIFSAGIEVINKVKTAISNIISAINDVIGNIKNSIASFISGIDGLLGDIASGIKNMLSSNCKSVSTALSNIGTGVGLDSAVKSVTGNSQDAIEGAMSGVKTSLSNIQSGALSSFATSINTIKTGPGQIQSRLTILKGIV